VHRRHYRSVSPAVFCASNPFPSPSHPPCPPPLTPSHPSSFPFPRPASPPRQRHLFFPPSPLTPSSFLPPDPPPTPPTRHHRACNLNGGVPGGAGCRVERWRGCLGGGLSVCRPFRLPVPHEPHLAPFPSPAHRTGRAVFPHPALGEGLTRSPTQSSLTSRSVAPVPTGHAGSDPCRPPTRWTAACACPRATDGSRFRVCMSITPYERLTEPWQK